MKSVICNLMRAVSPNFAATKPVLAPIPTISKRTAVKDAAGEDTDTISGVQRDATRWLRLQRIRYSFQHEVVLSCFNGLRHEKF